MYSDFNNSAGPLLAVLIIVWIIALAVAVTIYVFGSLGLYTIAKRRNIKNAWLSWIPIGTYWIAGCIADQQMIGMGKDDKKFRHFACWFGLGGIVLAWIPFIGWAIAVTAVVFYYISLYHLFKSCDPDNAVLYLVLSIVISVACPIILFVVRKKDKGIPENGVYAPNNSFPPG